MTTGSGPWVALLRGINVGGRNRLAMADLRATLTASGLREVRTYIQSGNVVFGCDDSAADASALAETISADIDRAHGLDISVIVRSLDDVARVARSHPELDGDVPHKWLLVYLLDGPADADAAPDPARFAPDRLAPDGHEVYATYPAGSGRSKLTIDVIERSFGATATARNVATLQAIVALGRADSPER